MKFKYVGKPKIVDGEEVDVTFYGIRKGKSGSVVDITKPHLIEKAKKNPNYEQVK